MDKKDIFSYTSNFGSFTWRYEKFDSQILGRRTAKIITLIPSQATDERGLIKKLIDSFKQRDIEYATYRIRAFEFLTIQSLEEEGFRLVDGIISLEQVLTEPEKTVERAIRKASNRDVDSLQRLATDAFSRTRFYNDPLIKKHQADKIYVEWIKNSVGGLMADTVFLWEEDEESVGFITLQKTNGRIVLIAVSKKHQGKGIGKALVKAALKQFMSWGVKKSTVETQVTNISAIRSYQACGYKIVNAYCTFRWSDVR